MESAARATGSLTRAPTVALLALRRAHGGNAGRTPRGPDPCAIGTATTIERANHGPRTHRARRHRRAGHHPCRARTRYHAGPARAGEAAQLRAPTMGPIGKFWHVPSIVPTEQWQGGELLAWRVWRLIRG